MWGDKGKKITELEIETARLRVEREYLLQRVEELGSQVATLNTTLDRERVFWRQEYENLLAGIKTAPMGTPTSLSMLVDGTPDKEHEEALKKAQAEATKLEEDWRALHEGPMLFFKGKPVDEVNNAE
jgi:hypothetical protein